MSRVVDYYFAPQSPWTFLGHDRFVELAKAHDLTVAVKAVDLGRVFSVSGGLPLAQRPKQRQSYRLLELTRFAKHLGVALNVQPRFFPVNGEQAALRILAATTLADQATTLRFISTVTRGVWVDQRDIADLATLDAMASESGLDAYALGEAAGAEAIAARYQALTDEAIAEEVFGAPTWIPRFGPAAGERFWGQDRLDLLASAIA